MHKGDQRFRVAKPPYNPAALGKPLVPLGASGHRLPVRSSAFEALSVTRRTRTDVVPLVSMAVEERKLFLGPLLKSSVGPQTSQHAVLIGGLTRNYRSHAAPWVLNITLAAGD